MKKALKPSFQSGDQPILALGNILLTSLTGNAYFPTPVVPLTDLQTALSNYSIALSKAEYGSREDIAQKNAYKQTLVGLMRDECDYINMVAKGDIVKLSTCGLPLSKDRQPKILGTPEASVENGASGKLILSTPAVWGAVSYKHKYKADPNAATWTEISTSRATCTIEGLTPGTVYTMQIEAIGTKNQLTTSNVVTKMAA